MITGDPCIAVHSSRCHLSCDSRNDTPKGEMDKRSVSWVAEVHQCLLYTHHRQTVPIPQWLLLKASTMYIHSQWGQWLILKASTMYNYTFPMGMWLMLKLHVCTFQWVWCYMCAHSQWVWGYVHVCIYIPNGNVYTQWLMLKLHVCTFPMSMRDPCMIKARLHHYTTRVSVQLQWRC